MISQQKSHSMSTSTCFSDNLSAHVSVCPSYIHYNFSCVFIGYKNNIDTHPSSQTASLPGNIQSAPSVPGFVLHAGEPLIKEIDRSSSLMVFAHLREAWTSRELYNTGNPRMYGNLSEGHFPHLGMWGVGFQPWISDISLKIWMWSRN